MMKTVMRPAAVRSIRDSLACEPFRERVSLEHGLLSIILECDLAL